VFAYRVTDQRLGLMVFFGFAGISGFLIGMVEVEQRMEEDRGFIWMDVRRDGPHN
jgi:hypothetical protein